MKRLNEIPVFKPSDIPGHHVKAYVNSLYDSICEGIHSSVKMKIKQESTRSIRGPKRWFSSSCKAAKNRNKLFHYIWKSCGRPNKGQVYDCYRTARKEYRRCCRRAVQSKSQRITTLIETMYRERKSKKFWNLIRSSKQNPNAGDAIDTKTLVKYFIQRFSDPAVNSNVLECARRDVSTKYTTLVNTKLVMLKEGTS